MAAPKARPVADRRRAAGFRWQGQWLACPAAGAVEKTVAGPDVRAWWKRRWKVAGIGPLLVGPVAWMAAGPVAGSVAGQMVVVELMFGKVADQLISDQGRWLWANASQGWLQAGGVAGQGGGRACVEF